MHRVGKMESSILVKQVLDSCGTHCAQKVKCVLMKMLRGTADLHEMF